MLKQPVSVVNYTNVAIVKLKIGKQKFEIACYKNKVQQFRQKVETDINEVLQIDKIYKNAIKGDLAKKEELTHYFPNMEYEDIVKLILEKGDIQISEKERNLNYQNTKNEIANIIVEKTFNTENGLPFPNSMILQVLDDIKFNLRDDQDTKKQALKAIKLIQEKNILPIERKYMSFNLYIKEKNNIKDENDLKELTNKVLSFLEKINAVVLEKNVDKVKTFKIHCNVLPNYYRDLITNFEDILSIETLSFTESIIKKQEKQQQSTNYAYYESLKEKEKAQNVIKVKKTEEEEMQETFAKMKVSNHLIDRLLDEYEQDKLEEKAKNSSEPIDTTPKRKAIVCTKCKGTEFYEQTDLRKHFKTDWHTFNAKLSAQGKESLSEEEYKDFMLMGGQA